METLSGPEMRTSTGEGSLSPEVAGLADGLARLLRHPVKVRSWSGPADVAALRELSEALSPGVVAVVCLTTGPGGRRPTLGDALEVAHAAGLEPAWSGFTRNSVTDIRRETPLLVIADDRAEEVRSALATGTANLLFDEGAPAGAPLNGEARICVASYEVVGPTKNGGIGTANTSLAELLALAGHHVTLLYTGWQPLDENTRGRWTRHYRERGVEFLELGNEMHLEVDTPHFNQRRAYEVYRWLREREDQAAWDVIHFPECQGHGYYALLARRLGLAFAESTFAVGVHSPTRWVYEANGWVVESAHRLADDFLEHQCVELADVVISPSAYLLAWMEASGWKLPARRFVQQYAQSGAVPAPAGGAGGGDAAAHVVTPEGPGTQAARELGYQFGPPDPAPEAIPPAVAEGTGEINEIVFFGRLETRKGLETFCDALDILAEERTPPHFLVTFMGSETPIQGIPAGEYLRTRARHWPWPPRIESDRNQLEAVAYIRQPGRLAVMPSPVDNSPNTVLEALGLGIPFITSRGGGIPELINPLDLDQTTFDPGRPGASPGGESLAEAIRRATARGEAVRPRFAVDPELNQRVHVQWHERVAAARALRSAPAADEAYGSQLDSVSVCLPATGDRVALERLSQSLERQSRDLDELIVALPARGDAWVRGFGASLRDRGWRVVEGRTGELDAAAAAAATGDWLFLCEPGTLARKSLVATLVASAHRANADVVTAAVGYGGGQLGDDSGRWRGNVPLGGAALAGLFYDCFGIGGALIRRRTFEELGAFAAGGSPAVRRRDLLARAALAGVRSTVVPDCLLDYDAEDAGVIATPAADWRTVRPYKEALPPQFVELPGIALSLSIAVPPPADTTEIEQYARTLEGTLEVIRNSHSWRFTKPIRQAMDVLRRLRRR